MYIQTSATHKIRKLRKRIRAVQGGTSASKTVSILLILIAYCQSDPVPTLTSVVSESFPHLKRGAIRDFLSILQQPDKDGNSLYDDARWNRSDYVYTFETGSKLEFFSADQPSKVRGPRRDRLFINECNNVAHETFDQLEIRTKDLVFLDWNPASEFWYNLEVAKRNDVDFCIVTYRDNEALSKQIVQAIEQRKGNKNWWRVYGEGQLGEIEGRIYTDWQIVDEVPHEAKLDRYGLDFGYTNDPTANIAVYHYNGGIVLDETCYQWRMSNRMISDMLKNLPQSIVVADSAEPKSIDELKDYGHTVIPAVKGPGSISQGIAYVQDQRISITKRSVHTIKEYRAYLWMTDSDGKVLNEPDKRCADHAMDAIRYALQTLQPPVDDLEAAAERWRIKQRKLISQVR